MRMEGKVAWVTGAARGIGAAAARRFVAEGAKVMLVDVREDGLRELAAQLGDSALAMCVDVSDEDACARSLQAAVTQFGRLDVVALNAGIVGNIQSWTEYPVEEFDRVMAVNVRGAWIGIKHAMRLMRASGGSIVVTSSTWGVQGTPNMSPYVASKHALVGLVRAAAIEGAPNGIRVNAVNPAAVDTPMASEANRVGLSLSNTAEAKARMIPLGRAASADEVANMMLFLASDESLYCTGGVYMVDGGVTAGRPA